MHVLLIGLHHFTQPTGLCRFTASLYLALKRSESVRVTLVLGAWQKDYFARTFKLDIEDEDIVWVDLDNPHRHRYGWYLNGAPQLAKEINPSLVHAVFPIPLVRKRFTCPIVTTIHDLYAWDAPDTIGYPNVWINKLVTVQSLRSSDGVTCISLAARNSLRSWFPDMEDRMALPVIYQEFSPKSLKVEGETGRGGAPLNPYVLCVAQHRKHKNLDLAIEAYYTALDRGILAKDVRLVIVGSAGPQSEELYELASRREGVDFLSGIPDGQLAELYRNCAAMICASSIEGFCLPLAEALTFSCKVVCADIPILREVAGEQGTYFSLTPRSADALADALKDALHSDRNLNGKSPILQRNSDRKMLLVYRQVLKQQAPKKEPSVLQASATATTTEK